MLKKVLLKAGGCLLLFAVVYAVVVGLFVTIVKTIPRERIEPNLIRTAEYFHGKDMVVFLLDGVTASRVDNMCDPYVLNILNYQDEKDPARSIAMAMFYAGDAIDTPESLYRAITQNPEPNEQYLRYWHGSTAVLRLLMLRTDIAGIYRFHTILMVILVLLISILMVAWKLWREWICVLAAFAAGSLWYSVMSLEYTWCSILMLLFSVVTLLLCKAKKWSLFPAVCMVAGMLINFFDFLTYETVTLTVPLLLFCICAFRENKALREIVTTVIGSCAAWIFGYGAMWAGKWAFSAVVLKRGVMDLVVEHIEERLVGDTHLSSNYLIGTFQLIKKELICLFPFGYGAPGAVAGVFLLIFVCSFCYVFHKKSADKGKVKLYLLLSLIPIIRFLVMRNHTAMHDAYTFRALIGTVLALLLAGEEWVDWEMFKRKKPIQKRKNKK